MIFSPFAAVFPVFPVGFFRVGGILRRGFQRFQCRVLHAVHSLERRCAFRECVQIRPERRAFPCRRHACRNSPRHGARSSDVSHGLFDESHRLAVPGDCLRLDVLHCHDSFQLYLVAILSPMIPAAMNASLTDGESFNGGVILRACCVCMVL